MKGATQTALAVAALFLIVAAFAIDDYGFTWDVANGEVPHGERYLGYLETGDPDFLELGPSGRKPELPAPHPDGDVAPVMPLHQSYPLSAILSAVSCRVLFVSLGVIGAIPAHLWVAPVFVALLVFLIVRSGTREVGIVAGLMGGVLLIGSPRFFAHAMNNLKDAPEAALYFLSMLLIYRSFDRGDARSLAFAGFIGGLALAQKPNALFLPIHGFALLLIWLVLARVGVGERPKLSWRGAGLAAVLFPLAWIVASPRMWADPFGVAVERLAFLKGVSTQAGLWEPLESLRMVAVTTPLVVLALALIGLLGSRARGPWRLFLVLGMLIPLARTSLPSFRNFDGVRHFLEFWPFMALLAGLGAHTVVSALTGRIKRESHRRGASVFVVLLLAAHPVIATASLHPNGICYYNQFTGGLAGERSRDASEASDYWANSYHQGFRLLGDWDPVAGSRLIVPVAEHVARSEAPVMLPDGVSMADPYQDPPGACYVMFITRESWYGAYADLIAWLLEGDHQVREIRVQGAPILKLFRLEAAEDVARAHALWSEPRAYYRLLMELSRRGAVPGVIGAPGAALYLAQIQKRGADQTIRELTELVPEDLRQDVPAAVRFALRIATREGG